MGDLRARAIFPLACFAKLLQSCLTLCNHMDCRPPGSSVHGILQEYWSGLPGPPPENLPNPGIEPSSPTSPALAGRFFTTSHLGSPFPLANACLKISMRFLPLADFG